MIGELINVKWTKRVVKEQVRVPVELLEFIGTNEQGDTFKVYVYKVEKIEKDSR
ncbi:hypothetical protein [Chryseobacterium sp. Marseille-Q3244]|uniref:hypothetical protein n=1 Tax=Chryseobacterium sp. Marseille-Q3244 TaxID=2758092 RepID=UPI002024DF77|nr:hypothetical protein [Chryseobacterium sp. Marseille-Q3244]